MLRLKILGNHGVVTRDLTTQLYRPGLKLVKKIGYNSKTVHSPGSVEVPDMVGTGKTVVPDSVSILFVLQY